MSQNEFLDWAVPCRKPILKEYWLANKKGRMPKTFTQDQSITKSCNNFKQIGSSNLDVRSSYHTLDLFF